jgi:hypothetical protein
VSEGQDPRRLPGGDETPTPPAPVQVQWPQTVAVIFNPSSGGDTAGQRSDRIRQAIQETGKKLIWLETTREDSGQGPAKDAVEQGADLVIATGGDGTVMACATALAGSEVPLAVLPLGTGNLVATNFDIPNDLDQALEIALACRRRRIDLGAIGDGRFVIAAGMGFDAAMLRDANHTLKAGSARSRMSGAPCGTCVGPGPVTVCGWTVARRSPGGPRGCWWPTLARSKVGSRSSPTRCPTTASSTSPC